MQCGPLDHPGYWLTLVLHMNCSAYRVLRLTPIGTIAISGTIQRLIVVQIVVPVAVTALSAVATVDDVPQIVHQFLRCLALYAVAM